jgi:hypothetical protein
MHCPSRSAFYYAATTRLHLPLLSPPDPLTPRACTSACIPVCPQPTQVPPACPCRAVLPHLPLASLTGDSSPRTAQSSSYSPERGSDSPAPGCEPPCASAPRLSAALEAGALIRAQLARALLGPTAPSTACLAAASVSGSWRCAAARAQAARSALFRNCHSTHERHTWVRKRCRASPATRTPTAGCYAQPSTWLRAPRPMLVAWGGPDCIEQRRPAVGVKVPSPAHLPAGDTGPLPASPRSVRPCPTPQTPPAPPARHSAWTAHAPARWRGPAISSREILARRG